MENFNELPSAEDMRYVLLARIFTCCIAALVFLSPLEIWFVRNHFFSPMAFGPGLVILQAIFAVILIFVVANIVLDDPAN